MGRPVLCYQEEVRLPDCLSWAAQSALAVAATTLTLAAATLAADLSSAGAFYTASLSAGARPRGGDVRRLQAGILSLTPSQSNSHPYVNHGAPFLSWQDYYKTESTPEGTVSAPVLL